VDRVLCELAVRGYTSDPSSGVAHPGTFGGLKEALPHLQRLGVTTIQLLPVAAWNENEIGWHAPATGGTLRNLWGYSPLGLLAPHPGLARGTDPAAPSGELTELVRACHEAGVEVFLDVVYNHTGEGELEEGSPVYSMAGLAPDVYYRFDEAGRRIDLTGCGNTLDTSEPVVQDLVLAALRHWAGRFGVDGFRFDLAAALTRDLRGEAEIEPSLVRRIVGDPVVGSRALVAEAWDAAGLYRVGEFPGWGPWSEWNDRYRNGVRRFLRGDAGFGRELALRVAGSPDLYQGSPLGPGSSVNYVTCHDGFTLADLVAYEAKRNLDNGEGNRDGSDANWSAGYGIEGPTNDPEILGVRRRQVRNFLVTLLVSQGVPMLRAGDELGNSQAGNNNAYCQDGPVGWVQWSGREDPHLVALVCRLTDFRRRHPSLRRRAFPREGVFGADGPFRWHAETLGSPRRLEEARALALELLPLGSPAPDVALYVAWNPTPERRALPLPPGDWIDCFDTAREPPYREPAVVRGDVIQLEGWSVRVLRGVVSRSP
jgi:glycogen operon protein